MKGTSDLDGYEIQYNSELTGLNMNFRRLETVSNGGSKNSDNICECLKQQIVIKVPLSNSPRSVLRISESPKVNQVSVSPGKFTF